VCCGLVHLSDTRTNGALYCHPERAGASAEATRDQREAILPSPAMKNYWVYITSGRTRTLYVGVTNDIERRSYEHGNRSVPGFSSKYNLDRLVYLEEHADIRDAIERENNRAREQSSERTIEREKRIKSWRQEKKLALIESLNPRWRDLSLDWRLTERPWGSEKSLRVDPSTPPQKMRLGSG
jgi:putative endonuclease